MMNVLTRTKLRVAARDKTNIETKGKQCITLVVYNVPGKIDLPCRPSQAIANLVLHAPIAIYSRSNAIQLEITRRKNYGREAERQ